jgi:hypothetical protein
MVPVARDKIPSSGFDQRRFVALIEEGELLGGRPVLDENGHDWQKPPLRQRMVGNYLEVCGLCGMERVGPRTREPCSGGASTEPCVPRHRAD